MLFAALAGLSGLVWGVGDFAGGKAAQGAAALPVAWLSKLVSLPLLAIYLAATYQPLAAAAIGWGGLAGCFGVLGMILAQNLERHHAIQAGVPSLVHDTHSTAAHDLQQLVVGDVIAYDQCSTTSRTGHPSERLEA